MAEEKNAQIAHGQNIDELEAYFKKATLRTGITLNKGETVIDPNKFYKSHIATIRNNPNSPTTLPFLERLLKFKAILEQ